MSADDGVEGGKDTSTTGVQDCLERNQTIPVTTTCFLSWTQRKVNNNILILVTVLLLVPFLCEAKLSAKIKPEIVLVMLLLTFEPFDIL